jgi:hypothetical protein
MCSVTYTIRLGGTDRTSSEMTYVGRYVVEKEDKFLMAVSSVEIIVRWW